MNKGKFIVLEGGEGAGKSTLAREIEKTFGILRTHEPGGTPRAEAIRKEVLFQKKQSRLSVKEEFSLMWEARADHVANLILPNLHYGSHVICDRFDGSTYAYQVCGEDGDDLREMFFTKREEVLFRCEPDLYLILDVPVEIGLARMRESTKKQSVFDEREEAFHERVRAGFSEFAELARDCGAKAEVIDASQSPEQVKAEVFDHIMRLEARLN